jgi:hypothetical protein
MRVFLLLSFLSLSSFSLFAQGAGEITIIPAVEREVGSTDLTGLTGDGKYLLTWVSPLKAGKEMRYDIYEVDSKQHVKTVLRQVPDQVQVIVTLMERGGATYLITLNGNATTKRMDIKAQEYAMPEFEPVGEPKVVGSIDVFLENHAYVNAYDPKIKFFPSNSGKLLLMTNYQMHGKNSTVSCWVLDEEMEVTQQAEIPLQNAADIRTLFQGGMVTENNEAFVMVQANFTDSEKKGLGNRIHKIKNGEVTTIHLTAPSDVEVLSAYLVPSRSNVSIGGFYSQKKTNGGRFHASMPIDHTGPLTVKLVPFTEETVDLNHARSLTRPDGGIYLIGNSVKEEGLAKKGMNVSAISATGELEWSKMIPRKLGPVRMIKEGFVAFESAGDLVILFPDAEQNLENYRNGEEPKIALKDIGSLITFAGRFNENGESTYDVLGAPTHTILFDQMNVLPGRNTIVQYAAPSGSKEHRNKAYAVVDLPR